MKRKISSDGVPSVEDPGDDDDCSQNTPSSKRDEGSIIMGSVGIPGIDEDSPDIANYTYFPRLFKLRQDHNIKQEIVCHLSKLHHITKDHKGFYRVRICRTCSGLPHLLELGSYSDLESATLVNDVHEFLNNRTRHLHVITEDDIRYIDQISVTRTWRHERSEVKLLELLQERLDKSKSNQSKTSVHYSNPYIYGQGLMGMPPGMPPSQTGMGMWSSSYHGGQAPPPHMMGAPQQQQQQQQHFADAAMLAANGNAFMMQRLQAQKGVGGNSMSHQPQQQHQQLGGGMMSSSTHQQGPSLSMYSQAGPGGNSFNSNASNSSNSGDSIQSAMDDNYDGKTARVTNVNVDAELKTLSRSQQEDVAPSQQHSGQSSSGSGGDLGGLHSLLGAAQSLMPSSSVSSGGPGMSNGGGSGPSVSTPWGVQPQSQLQYHQQQQHQHQQSNAQQQHPFNPMMTQQQQQQQQGGMTASMYGGAGSHLSMMGGGMGSQGQPNQYMQQQPHPGQGMPGAYGMWGGPQHPHPSGQMTMMGPPQPANSPNMFQQHQQFLMQQQQTHQTQHQQSQNQGSRPIYPPSMQQQQQQAMNSMAASFAQQQQSGAHSQMSPRGVPGMPVNRGNGFFGGSQIGGSSSFDPSNPAGSMITQGGMSQMQQQQQMPSVTPSAMDSSNHWGGSGLGNAITAARSSKSEQNPPFELSEETIQRVTLMTYEFEGAKNFLFQKLNCACAVENSSYFVNLALDSLIALFVAPSYTNPMYTQNAIRAIEYVMSSGCITSASLYLLAVAYTPGGYETSTMMLRNLHSAMKMYERKFEQQACSSRRMSFYSSKVIQYMKSSNISRAKVLDAAKPKIEATGKLAQLEDADAANNSTSSSIARASNVLCAVQNSPFPTVPSGAGPSNGVPYKSCSVVTMPASMAEWEAYFSKILRCNHTIALKCDLNVRMPVWWPNSFQPFGQSSTMSSNISNFLHFECIIRGEFATSQFHYKIISNLVDAFVEAGYESHIVSLNRSEKDRLAASSPPPQGLGEPEDLPVFACTTNLLMLSSYGTCTVMMRSLELLADLNVLPSSECSADVDKEGDRHDNGMSRVLDSCIVEFCRWKKYFDDRISDPAVIGMYQSIFMDLLVLLLGSKRSEPKAAAEDASPLTGSVSADASMEKTNSSAPYTNEAVRDDGSTHVSLLGQPSVSPAVSSVVASVTAGVVAESEAMASNGSIAEGNSFISSRFKTLLDVIADVSPLPVESMKDQRAPLDLSKFSTKSLTRVNIYAILRELVRDTQLSGIAGNTFQHPLRADNNKFAPHFTVAHEISLRINMSCLSILGEVSVHDDHCLAESSICSSVRGLLNPEAAILGVYREMLFLGEWMDASEGGCPLFSHTYMAFWLCLKACRKLVPKYPTFADVLNKILVLIPRILKSCSRRNGLCTVLLEFEEEEGFGLADPSAAAPEQPPSSSSSSSAATVPPPAATTATNHASTVTTISSSSSTSRNVGFGEHVVNNNAITSTTVGEGLGAPTSSVLAAADSQALPAVDAARSS